MRNFSVQSSSQRVRHTTLALAITMVLSGSSVPIIAAPGNSLVSAVRVVEPLGPAVLFVDSRVRDAGTLLRGVRAGTEVVTLDAKRDGLRQMAEYLAHHREAGSVEIIAHGNAGELLLGNTDLTAANIASRAQTLGAIGTNLKRGADILVYACNTAADEQGVHFVDTLASLTGHSIAAATGVVGKGGSWDLRMTTGDISAAPVLSAEAAAGYGYDLATLEVTNGNDSGAGSLRAAISTANGQSGDVIYFQTGVTSVSLSSGVLNVTSSMTIESDLAGNGGNAVTISAGFKSGVMSITGGTVKLNGLTLEDGLRAGNGGGFGSLNGQSALGAGLYVSGGTTKAYLSHVTIQNNYATGGGGGGAGAGYCYAGGGGSGTHATGGGSGGAYNASHLGAVGGSGSGGHGGFYSTSTAAGSGGTSGSGGSGGAGGIGTNHLGGAGATVGSGTSTIGGGGGGYGSSQGTVAGNGGNAVGGMYVGGGGKVYAANTVFSHNYGAGGGGGGAGNTGSGGTGGSGTGAVSVGGTGHFLYQSSTTTFTSNAGAAGTAGENAGGVLGTAGTGTSGISNLGSSGDVVPTWAPPPTVSATYISVSGATGTGGDYKIGDTVTASWNNTASGDNNSSTITGVTFDFSQFGGGTAVVASNVGNVWTATYTITAGSIDATGRNVAVTATNATGGTTTSGTNNVTVDDIHPVVTTGNIILSGGTGTGGAFKIGDTVTAQWDNSGTGDNNIDTINAGGVTMNFSQFGGGSTVPATNAGGIWTATYTITAGSINTSSAHVVVTVTDHAGNATITSSSTVTVDNITTSSVALMTNCEVKFVAGQNFTARATVTGYSPTGTVSFLVGGNNVSGCTAVTLITGTASCEISNLPFGQSTITATYGGDANNTSSGSLGLDLTILDPTDVIWRNSFEETMAGCPTE